jgi:hypothetical protein
MYDPDGDFVWKKTYGSTGEDYAAAVAVDALTPANRVLLAVNFEGTVNFGGPNPTSLESAGDKDVAVLQLAGGTGGSGTNWKHHFGGTGQDRASDIAVLGSNGVVVTGDYESSATIGSQTLNSAGLSDVFVIRTNSSGTLTYVKSFGGSLADRGLGAAGDSAGRATIVGSFSNGADFGAGATTSQGGTDAFVIMVQPQDPWNVSWRSTFGSSGNDEVRSAFVRKDANQHIVVTGALAGSSSNFPGGAVTGYGGLDAFRVRYNTSGGVHSKGTYGGSGDEVGISLYASAAGVGWAGWFRGAPSINGTQLSSNGGKDTFMSWLMQ